MSGMMLCYGFSRKAVLSKHQCFTKLFLSQPMSSTSFFFFFFQLYLIGGLNE